MSRLTDLIARAKAKDAQLGVDLEKEFRALSSRRAFGLNFERHRPEAVELPGRPVRKGDKVRILAPRGEVKRGDQRLWIVTALMRRDGGAIARLEAHEEPEVGHVRETAEAAVEDLVVIAAFGDTIYPGLISTGKVERGGDAPFHTVINAENYHALKALTYTHRGKIDAIYIDPPYNTGASDWKYNNNYVGEDDLYRHSKWLAFIERRLLVARELLNPERAALILTIDEKEYLRVGLLLEQVFPDAQIQMISSVINPKGTARGAEFSRVDEYVFFVFLGPVAVARWRSDMLTARDYASEEDVRWRGLARTGRKGLRSNNPGSWYPIYLNRDGSGIHSVGASVPLGQSDTEPVPAGTIAMWPPAKGQQQFSWSVVPETLDKLRARGAVRTGKLNEKTGRASIYYLSFNQLKMIEDGKIEVVGFAPDGSLDIKFSLGAKSTAAKTIWNMTSHDAGSHGTNILSALLPLRSFPFPKSLYAVEDALRFIVADKPDATILDFFSGSGTTAHAVMRLNKQDGGRRQCISVTNNEVAANEQNALKGEGLRPGDADWERWGICDYITKPRIRAAITGRTPDGAPIKGEYKFTDEFPMAEGFEANAEFFTLTYETSRAVDHNKAFARIAPLLWIRAGSTGRRIETLPEGGWEIVETYGLLTDMDQAEVFGEACAAAEGLRMAFIVTNDDRRFEAVCRLMPEGAEPVRLYESYLTNFAFESGGGEE